MMESQRSDTEKNSIEEGKKQALMKLLDISMKHKCVSIKQCYHIVQKT